MSPRRDDRNESVLTGVGDAVIFLLFVAAGAAYIVWAKLANLPAAAVTTVPVVVMLFYAAAVIFVRALRLKDDLSGDNLYYMGFLFTLTSLAVSLWQFDAEGAAEDIVKNFGVAIASTIAGIALRIFLNQMRRDPVGMERVARTQLADSARRLRRELDAAVLEFGQFRRASRQAAEEHWTAVREDIATGGRGVAAELELAADASVQPIEAASRRSGEALEALVSSLAAATGRIDGEAVRLAAGVDGLTKALEAFTARLAALGEPDRIVAMKVEPVISPLTAMVESFSHSLTTHAEALKRLTDRLDDAASDRGHDRAAIAELRDRLETVTALLEKSAALTPAAAPGPATTEPVNPEREPAVTAPATPEPETRTDRETVP